MKAFAETWIANRKNNLFLGAVIWIVIFLLAKYFVYKPTFGDSSSGLAKLVYFLFLFGSFALVASSKKTVEPRHEEHLLDIFGKSTSVFLSEGWYLTFFLFDFDPGETRDLEREKIEVGPIKFTDVDGKAVEGFITAIWYPGESEQEKKDFKMMKEPEIPGNLKQYLEHSFVQKFGGKKFSDARKETHTIFKASELAFCGVRFKEINPMLLSGNLTQDDFNAQFERLKKIRVGEFKTLTGKSSLTPEEAQRIDDQILLELNRIRKIITNSALLGRYDIQ